MTVPKKPAREKIVDAASRLFYGEGIRAVSVDAIAEKAGVTKNTLYYHFKSKDDLGLSRILLAGGLAGSFGWSFIMPFDVAKTRLQAGSASVPTEGEQLTATPKDAAHRRGLQACF